VVGCSVLYHLTKLGWTDVVLIERSELTSGSTWHAAGGFHTLNADTNMAALQGYTIGLYNELEEVSGQSCGLHHAGGITIATTPERMDFLVAERAKHRLKAVANSTHRSQVTPTRRGKGNKPKAPGEEQQTTPGERHGSMSWASACLPVKLCDSAVGCHRVEVFFALVAYCWKFHSLVASRFRLHVDEQYF
jgi:glycine/D-amino acid oxidase-like deaminating enzyme